MKRLRSHAKLLLIAAIAGASCAAIAGAGLTKKANAADGDAAEKNERCAVRLSIALLGASPAAPLLAATDPQSQVDAIVKTPEFVERFARFINQKMNDDPGATPAEDSAYHMAKFVLTNGRPWKDVFVGALNVTATGTGDKQTVTVAEDANGLGYFRSQPWLLRYAGNELQGIKISTAYRMLNNALGLKLVATTNAPGADVSATGRAAPACRGCHFDGWYALDKTAELLTRVVRDGDKISFTPGPNAGTPKPALGDRMVTDDKDLVTQLVGSDQFTYNACHTAFEFLYGRGENVCENDTFDACVAAFKTKGAMVDAIASVAKDASFCQ